MAREIVCCPHCSMQVMTMDDGVCPACRKDTRQAPAPVLAQDIPITHENAWHRYQETLRSSPAIEPTISGISDIERPFTALRMRAVGAPGAHSVADAAAAGQIQSELLPQFAASVDYLQQQRPPESRAIGGPPRLIDYVRIRQESWRLLAESLLENDREKLQRHVELWASSEVLMLELSTDNQPLAKPTPGLRVRDFLHALVTFTPRLIATPVLVIANIVVFAAMIAKGVDVFSPSVQSIAEWGANFGPKTMNGQWWRLVTCTFLHFGIIHLAFNMWVLWDLGRLVERLVGNVGFLVLYLVSGISGSIASLAWNPTVVSAGASGAVFGVAGALLGVIALRRDTIPLAVLKSLRKSMFAFIVYNVFFSMVVTGIDSAAHIGGLAGGFVCGLILSQPLSVEMIGRRRLRNLAVVVAAAIALPLAVFALPPAAPDIQQELTKFSELEKRALDKFEVLLDRSHRGVISEAGLAEGLEREVLPLWVEARKHVDVLAGARNADPAYLSSVAEYARLRQESWQLQIEGLRQQDPSKLQQANEKSTAAAEVVKKLASSGNADK